MKKLIITITGMSGAGKGLASQVTKEIGMQTFFLGDVIRDEAKVKGIPPTPKNLGKLMLEIREKEGEAIVAKRLLSKMIGEKAKLLVVEGVRSIKEIEEFNKFYETIILGVHSSPKERFRRLIRRKRSDDPRTWNEFVERDKRELRVGIGDVLALSDIMIVNSSTKKKFKDELRLILLNLEKKS